MKYYLIISFILINLSISIDILSSLVSQGMSKFGINYLPDLERQEAESLRGKLFIILRDIVEAKNISNITKLNISESCLNVINRYLLGHIDEKNSSNISYIISDYNIIKFLDDSSKNRNNLATYTNCMEKTYKMKSLYNTLIEYLLPHIAMQPFPIFQETKSLRKNDMRTKIYQRKDLDNFNLPSIFGEKNLKYK